MYYVYILLDCNKNFYIGFSNNLKRRIEEHKRALVYATKQKLPIELIYYEGCFNKYDAVKREKYLKSGPGRKFLKNRLRYYLDGLGPVRSLA